MVGKIRVERFMTEISTYPNGKQFIRSWIVGSTMKDHAPKKPKLRELDEVEIGEAEEY